MPVPCGLVGLMLLPASSKVAAQTYRQSGNDFFPGPLNADGQTDATTCNNYDQHWEVLGEDIGIFQSNFEESGGQLSVSNIPESLLRWPGKNNPHFSDYNSFELTPDKEYAPFYDADGNEEYNPEYGDYPVIDDCSAEYADQMIWWIFNDRGNTHTETGGEAIGLEISALAFAFVTNDEINSMTFYRYQIDNRSTTPLDSTYFGQWVDPDLGFFEDDYVGCVPEEGLGIVYNGDAVDEGEYGNDPPMLGVDFFKGPQKIEDMDGDGDLDTTLLGMSSFLFYNNDFEVTGNPENASHFYGYLAGVWKDGSPFTCGGNGYGGSEECDYMFPADPTTPEPAWSECTVENNAPADRRFLQSAGPFRLDPGAVNEVIVGVVWVRGLQYPCPSFDLILQADTKAQALFDNCFQLIKGPDAPTMTVRELDEN